MGRRAAVKTGVDGKAAAKLIRGLGIKKTPDRKPKRTRAPRSKGKKTGMGICDFWSALFAANEALPRTRKMTDEEIKRQVIEEFPDRKSVQRLGKVGERGKVTINEHRLLYNLGRYTRGVKPKQLSRRYNADGNVVDGRTGKFVEVREVSSGQE